MEHNEAFWALLREGQTCEVLSEKNDLIFLGKIHLTHLRTMVEVTQATGQPVPPVLYNTRVKVKMYFTSLDIRIMEAFVCGSSRYFWRLDHLRPLHGREKRESFRQKVTARAKLRHAEGEVHPEGSTQEEVSCRLVDLSLGGVQLCCKGRYSVGDWLHITDVAILDQAPFSFLGQVCWFREEERGELAYGCRFVEIEPREQDRLIQTIFDLQRKSFQGRKLHADP